MPTEGEFRAWLEARVQAAAFPELTPDEIDTCVVKARRIDSDGLFYGDDGWTETWDDAAAEQAGWELKAAKVAGDFSFSSDGQSFQRAEMHAHFTAMADRARNRRGGTISTVDTWPWTDILGNVNVGGG